MFLVVWTSAMMSSSHRHWVRLYVLQICIWCSACSVQLMTMTCSLHTSV